MLEPLKPFARALKYRRLYARAQRLASSGAAYKPDEWHAPPVYVVGCGRSGTTILGDLLSRHPQVEYLFEPYHSWAAIDPRSDMTNLYTSSRPLCIMGEGDCTAAIRDRFEGVFGALLHSRDKRLIEKTPIHAMRLGYLNAIAPDARFVHIRRRCAPVANSIEKLASGNTYKIFGKPELNQWWGVREVKWSVLCEQGEKKGYDVEGISVKTEDHWLRGVYEWYCTERSVRDALSQDGSLGKRVLEVTYEDFLDRPSDVLASIVRFARLSDDATWRQQAASEVKPRTYKNTSARELPRVVRDLEDSLYSDRAVRA